MTGDIHAITAAHNLFAAAIDTRNSSSAKFIWNRLCPVDKHGKRQFEPSMYARLEEIEKFCILDIDPDTITWRNAVELRLCFLQAVLPLPAQGDKYLRKVEIGLNSSEFSKKKVREAGVKDGDSLTLHVQRTQAVGTVFAIAAILGDGSVVTQGAGSYGGDSSAVQDMLTNVQQIQASTGAFAAILIDGSVVTWGLSHLGGDSSAVQEQLRLKRVKQIQAARNAFAAILLDGSVVTWGGVECGGDSSSVQDQLKNVQQIQATRSAWNSAFAAVLADGSVVTWGDAGCGGDSSAVQHQLKNVQMIQASSKSFAAVLDDGSVVSWGDAKTGGDSSKVQRALKKVQAVQATPRAFAAILGSGSVVTWGDAKSGGDSSVVQDQLKNVQQIQASSKAFAAILGDGSVVTWGSASHGGDSSAVQDRLRNVQQIQASSKAFAAVLADGSVVPWGYARSGGDSNAVKDQLRNVQQIQASQSAFAAILGDGSVVTWGDAKSGGDSSSVKARSRSVHQIQSNRGGFAAILADGSVETWGDISGSICVEEMMYGSAHADEAAPRLSPALVRPVVAPGPHVQLQGYPGQMPLPSPAAPGTPSMALQSHPFAVAAPSMMARLSSQALPAPRAAWPGPVAGVQHLAPAPVPPTQPLSAPLVPIPARAQVITSARMPWGAPILHQVTLREEHAGGDDEEPPHACVPTFQEIMAILALATDLKDLRTRLGKMICCYSKKGEPITADDFGITGSKRRTGSPDDGCAATVLRPGRFSHTNTMQTLEGTPALVHDLIGLKLVGKDGYVLTEAPKIVAGQTPSKEYSEAVVAINRFGTDTDAELEVVKKVAQENGAFAAVVAEHHAKGGAGATDLGKAVMSACKSGPSEFKFLYDAEKDSIKTKILKVVQDVYGGADVKYSAKAEAVLAKYESDPAIRCLPICMSKTQYSLSDDPKKLGESPRRFEFCLEGAPKGFTITVQVKQECVCSSLLTCIVITRYVSAGAGFIVVSLGDITFMPGLPIKPAYYKIAALRMLLSLGSPYAFMAEPFAVLEEPAPDHDPVRFGSEFWKFEVPTFDADMLWVPYNNAILQACCQQGDLPKALIFFEEMK
ncbi:unnamed protein product, partial [Symbiodinium sp. KB8]